MYLVQQYNVLSTAANPKQGPRQSRASYFQLSPSRLPISSQLPLSTPLSHHIFAIVIFNAEASAGTAISSYYQRLPTSSPSPLKPSSLFSSWLLIILVITTNPEAIASKAISSQKSKPVDQSAGRQGLVIDKSKSVELRIQPYLTRVLKRPKYAGSNLEIQISNV